MKFIKTKNERLDFPAKVQKILQPATSTAYAIFRFIF